MHVMDITYNLFPLAFYFITFWLCIYVLTTNLRSTRKSGRVLPPGPYQRPIIGNLHQIGKKPHQSFAKLSKIYGPLMSVRLGSKQTILVSSAEMAREVLQKNDLICSNRSVPIAAQSLDHLMFSVGWLPSSSTQWRYIRKMCKGLIFTTKSLNSSQAIRQEKLKELRDYLHCCSRNRKAVDFGEVAFTTSLNSMSKTVFSVDFVNFDSDSSKELKDVVLGVFKYIGCPNLSDYFPVLRLIDPQGILRKAKSCHQDLFNIFDGFIDERLTVRQGSSETKKNDLLEALLDENTKNESKFSINHLKHLLLDLMTAGIDPVSSTTQWAMAELLRNTEKIEKVREELKQVIGKREEIQESDISKLPYLQAIVKETLRLHPPAPLLLPHKASEDVEIHGYTVPKDTQTLINVYAIGRDERIWKEPEMFKPERFLESEIDIKGKHFELIPFSAGRRICPGLPLAYSMVQLMLASLVHNIDWKLEGKTEPKDLDMDELFGMTLQKALPLKAIPVKL
ncbi:OLC1v1038992C1 [Oldenlandia corymbosa var. corymbosa]|uniref:OLC1v1038992C1 n=1 Tax=Oldenlandia corymbosa var. corymbosa TaxID=529605 RepID=A0AAV1D1A3_OLDCO|nr:OLC1v1038992C1 [Oldenlandia corymbosa var. corymbosa]